MIVFQISLPSYLFGGNVDFPKKLYNVGHLLKFRLYYVLNNVKDLNICKIGSIKFQVSYLTCTR